MKISEVVRYLETLRKNIGDIPVVIDDGIDKFELKDIVGAEVEAVCLDVAAEGTRLCAVVKG